MREFLPLFALGGGVFFIALGRLLVLKKGWAWGLASGIGGILLVAWGFCY